MKVFIKCVYDLYDHMNNECTSVIEIDSNKIPESSTVEDYARECILNKMMKGKINFITKK